MTTPRRSSFETPCSAAGRGLLAVAVFLPAACRTLEPEPTTAAGIDQPTFALIDRDGDGLVSPAEMAAYKHEEGLAEIDLDNDKRISPGEWRAARPSAPDGDAPFHRLDRNRDGFIDESEAVAEILGQSSFSKSFAAMDANGDGHLHWEEYAAGRPESLDVTLMSSAGSTEAP